MKREMEALKNEGREKKMQIENAEQEIESLNSQAGQQMHKLSQVAPDTHKAWKWIEENQDKFEKHVFGPPLIECSVKDPKSADILETVVQAGDMTSLTVQTKNDFETLHKALHEDLNLVRLSIRTVTEGLQRFPVPPLDKETMKRYGFDGWALDYLEGPEPVLAMLCESARLHSTAVALRDTTPEQYNRIINSRMTSWVTSKSLYQIRRREEYGPAATSTSVRAIKRAQVWTDKPVDMSIKEEHRKNIKLRQDEIKELHDKIGQTLEKFKMSKEQRDNAQSDLVRVSLAVQSSWLTITRMLSRKKRPRSSRRCRISRAFRLD